MKLRSLQLHGFKSFADRTTLDFREGVTAIVGSNGCGKSNIADAVRWVLGEQRASAMRGAKMEEVIFQGTARRRPLHFAEVTLLFDNDRGRVAIPQTEIEVARKVFREGGSDYSLNRANCRLRDIHDLLRGTGLGSNAYAVIEAGMIDTLLSDRAEERRTLFEEAAGIGKYKDSRRAAMRRLESAENDLARLEDLIAEVESKVRSLSRQRKKAERYESLRARRLDLEVAIASAELARLEEELGYAVRRRSELEAEEAAAAGERSAIDANTEERRLEVAELAQQRSAVAARLDRVRTVLDSREKEVLVAEERRSHAGSRIEQIGRERAELEGRKNRLAEEAAELGEARETEAAELERLKQDLAAMTRENDAIRAALVAARRESDTAQARSRELALEIATAEAERAAADRRRREAEERAADTTAQESGLKEELGSIVDQTELWDARVEEVRERLISARSIVERSRNEIRVLEGREQEARDALRAAEDRVSHLSAQVAAREAVERDYEGFSPAVAAIMADRDRFPGVHGPLADFVGEHRDDARAVDSYLGPLLQALVIEDLETARALRRWYREAWDGGGQLLLLPLDSPALQTTASRRGDGWVQLLLRDLVVVEQDPLQEHDSARSRVGPNGDLIDARGVVHLSDRIPAEGIVLRRETLERLREDRADAAQARDAAAAARESLRESLELAERQRGDAEDTVRTIEAELRELEAGSAAHQHHRGRLEEDRQRLAATAAQLRESARAAGERTKELEARVAELSASVESVATREQAQREELARLEEQWELARDRDSELRVAVATAEARLRDTDRRIEAAEQGSRAAADRLEALAREAEDLRRSIDSLAGVRERAATEIEDLFRTRDEEAAEIARLEVRLSELDAELSDLVERGRAARKKETSAAEERHRLELRIAELGSRSERVVERLEAEWGRTWEALLAGSNRVVEGELDAWQAELADIASQLESVGPVNMLAVEEHAEEEQRLAFLTAQRDDLVKAREDLVAAIRQINRTARDVFMETFDAVRANFQRVFQSLFHGGECDVWLEDPEDPLESPIEIHASPKGKRTQRIHLLSGGERTLTALALLFALYLVKPSPFCVLDEVDAPLDDTNVSRFLQLLADFKDETQFIVITHNPRTMESADWVYGVTMEEPGVSNIVGVELLGVWESENAVAAG